MSTKHGSQEWVDGNEKKQLLNGVTLGKCKL